ncbi:hypothetical protein MACK_002340 [Theileria orientalis]|uniref:Uncharacterized protein n=1 Tax=Theileria orientalis TaxID=68886 RepID=A0A976MC22_THEOR|nr:hypothetical protein MACK_002340 [Theileria orientalis]
MDPNNYNDIVYSLYKLANAGVSHQDVRYRQLLSALNTVRSRRAENVAEFTSLTGTGQNPFNSIQFNALLNQIDAYVNYITKALKVPTSLLHKCNPVNLLEASEEEEEEKEEVPKREELKHEVREDLNTKQDYDESELMEISDVFHRKNEFWGPGYFWLDYRDNLEQNKLSFFLGAITNVKTMTQYIIQNNNAILSGSTPASEEHNEHILRKFEQLFKDIGLYGYLLTFSTDEKVIRKLKILRERRRQRRLSQRRTNGNKGSEYIKYAQMAFKDPIHPLNRRSASNSKSQIKKSVQHQRGNESRLETPATSSPNPTDKNVEDGGSGEGGMGLSGRKVNEGVGFTKMLKGNLDGGSMCITSTSDIMVRGSVYGVSMAKNSEVVNRSSSNKHDGNTEVDNSDDNKESDKMGKNGGLFSEKDKIKVGDDMRTRDVVMSEEMKQEGDKQGKSSQDSKKDTQSDVYYDPYEEEEQWYSDDMEEYEGIETQESCCSEDCVNDNVNEGMGDNHNEEDDDDYYDDYYYDLDELNELDDDEDGENQGNEGPQGSEKLEGPQGSNTCGQMSDSRENMINSSVGDDKMSNGGDDKMSNGGDESMSSTCNIMRKGGNENGDASESGTSNCSGNMGGGSGMTTSNNNSGGVSDEGSDVGLSRIKRDHEGKLMKTDGRDSGNGGDGERSYGEVGSGEKSQNMENTVGDARQPKRERSPLLRSSTSSSPPPGVSRSEEYVEGSNIRSPRGKRKDTKQTGMNSGSSTSSGGGMGTNMSTGLGMTGGFGINMGMRGTIVATGMNMSVAGMGLTTGMRTNFGTNMGTSFGTAMGIGTKMGSSMGVGKGQGVGMDGNMNTGTGKGGSSVSDTGSGTGVSGSTMSPKSSKLIIKSYEESGNMENKGNEAKRARMSNGGSVSTSGSVSRSHQASQRVNAGESHGGGREGLRISMTIRKYDFEKLLMDILKLEKKINLLLLQKNVKSILNLTRLTNKMYADNMYSNENTRVEYKRNLMEHIKNSNQAHKEHHRLKRKFMQLANKFVYNKTFCNMADKEKANDNIRMTIQKDKRKIYLNVLATLEESKRQDVRNEESSKIEENVYANMPSAIAGKLRNYQLQGLSWLVSLYNNKLNGILADEMGLGKTIQTIALIIYLKENKGISGPHIVLAPMSTLHSNWKNEFETWFPTCKVCIYEGSKEWRKSLRQKWYEGSRLTFDVLLTTDSFILKDRAFLKKVCWEYLIVDEAHRLKNPNSKLVKVLNQFFISNRRLLLTGTPLQNDLNELWSLLNFVKPQIFNDNNYYYQLFSLSLSSLVRRYDDCVLFTEEEQLAIINSIHKVLKPFLLRREKLEVLEEVPRNDEFIVCCPMSGIQTRLYEFLVLKDTSQNRFLQLRKICNHPYLYANSSYPCDDMLISSCGKLCMLDLILSRLYEVNHRVLIFSQMTSMLDILEIYLSYRNYKFLRLDGSTTSEKRLERLNLFNKPNSEYFVFILSTKAGSLGINLQTADTVIIYDSDWNPQNDLQAQSRVHRIGQKNKVISLRLITPNTIEENILKSTGVKLNQNQVLIKSGTYQDLGETSDDDEQLKSVFNLRNEYTEEYGIRCVELLNRILTRSETDAVAFKYVGYKNFIMNPFPLIKHRVLPPFLFKTISANKRFQLTDGDKLKMNLDKNTWANLCDDYNIYAVKPTEQCKLNYITNIESSKISVEDKNKFNSDVLKHIITNLSIDYPVEYLTEVSEELNADIFKWLVEDNEIGKQQERLESQGESGKQVGEKKGNESKTPDSKVETKEDEFTPESKNVDSKGSDKKGEVKKEKQLETKVYEIKEVEERRRMLINKAIREEVAKVMNGKVYHEFNDLPNKSQIKDYYDKINNPISLREILTMSKENKYNSILEFKGKLQLLTLNARTYNGVESPIFHKSLNLTHILSSRVSYRVMLNLIKMNSETKAAIIDQLLSKYFI